MSIKLGNQWSVDKYMTFLFSLLLESQGLGLTTSGFGQEINEVCIDASGKVLAQIFFFLCVCKKIFWLKPSGSKKTYPVGKEASLLLVMLQTWTSLPLIKNHLCLPISVEIYKRNIMSAEFQVEKTLSYTLHVSHLEINHCKAQHCPLFPERMSLQGYTQNNAHLTS